MSQKCLGCYENGPFESHICDFCIKIAEIRLQNRQKGAEMAEITAEADPITPENTENDAENGQNEAENAPKTPPSATNPHLNFAARLTVSPTFDTNTGERLDNTESMVYFCKDCDWKTQVYDAGQAGNQLVIHALGLDDLNIEWLDMKDFTADAPFDIDNPEEVLNAMRGAQGEASNDGD